MGKRETIEKISWYKPLSCEKGRVIDVRSAVKERIKIITILNSATNDPETFTVDLDWGKPVLICAELEGYDITNTPAAVPLTTLFKGVLDKGSLWAAPEDIELMLNSGLKALGWTPPRS